MGALKSQTCKTILLLVLLVVLEIQGCSSRQSSKAKQNQAGRASPTKQKKQSASEDKVECQDENGNGVPWFIAYKLPKLKGALGATMKEGTGYSYILPGYTAWRPSEKRIGHSTSIVGNTLRPYFERSKTPDLAYMVYNDQPPYRDDIGYNGHSKGVILSKRNGGLWLVHSVPKFPLVGQDFYPTNGLVNAQMFLCLSLSTRDLDNVANIFMFTRPIVSNSTVPESLSAVLPTWTSFLGIKRYSSKGPVNKMFNLNAGQLNFQIYAKSPKFEKEIYVEWLAPSLRSSLEVQSWLSGSNAYVSNCTSADFPVYNIAEKKVAGDNFKRNDHSKWAVGTETANPWVCVSDLNRMEGQKSRGGATLCISDQKVWTAFKSAVIDLQPCARTAG